MPKERINCSTSDNSHAVVGWRPDPGDGSGHAQLATLHTAEPVVTISGAVPANATTSAMSHTAQTEPTGWYVDLNREQINRLIRVLRRARDAAYGPDA